MWQALRGSGLGAALRLSVPHALIWQVLEKDECEALGMGAYLGVSQEAHNETTTANICSYFYYCKSQ